MRSLFIPVAQKSMLQDLTKPWKAFSASCWLWKCFPTKKLSRCSWLVRGQVYMVNEAKFHSSICSTLEALVVWHELDVVMENWALFVDHCQLQHCSFIDLLSIILRCNGFARIQKAVSDQQRTTKQWPGPFMVRVRLQEVLWSFFSIQPLKWFSLVVI